MAQITQTVQVEWKAVRDEMPDDDRTVLIYNPDWIEPVWMGYFDGENWRQADAMQCVSDPTHWAEFPDTPTP